MKWMLYYLHMARGKSGYKGLKKLAQDRSTVTKQHPRITPRPRPPSPGSCSMPSMHTHSGSVPRCSLAETAPQRCSQGEQENKPTLPCV